MRHTESDTSKKVSSVDHRNWGRVALLPLLIGAGITLIFVFHIDQYLSFDTLAAHRSWLLAQVAHHTAVVTVGFLLIYVLATTLSVPGSSILTMTSGFLFGLISGTAIAVSAATIGATLLFVIARTSLGEAFHIRTQGALTRLQAGFGKNALSYLLFLRLVPAFPFWLVNLVAAFLKVPLRTFVVGTFLGVIPGAAVYASVGSGLGAILDRGQKPDLSIVLSPPILIPMLALAGLALVPVLYRRW
ncbi:MAG: TVP38/TMEM64 family protein [Alphaproteobacteria bacterium]|nr:TVP38/TMEM64 family protein [Alphaproteobacteria bacterium]MDE2493568.1 TVP38/TMEM64 family protein [Alphaproteobacteria bacterium]